VLLQLPFQPVLLHQWAVALLASALWLQRDLSPLYCLGHSANLRGPVKKLVGMCNKMQKCAIDFLSFFDLYTSNAHLNIHKIVELFLAPMLNALPEVLPIIEFCGKDEFKDIIRGLNLLAWKPKSKLVFDSDHVNDLGQTAFGLNLRALKKDSVSEKKEIDIKKLQYYVQLYVIPNMRNLLPGNKVLIMRTVEHFAKDLVKNFDLDLLLHGIFIKFYDLCKTKSFKLSQVQGHISAKILGSLAP